MTKVAFFFAGTNDTAQAYYERHGQDYTNFEPDDDLIKIYLDGCQVIGKSALYPDLETPTNLIQKAFEHSIDGQVELDLSILKKGFGSSVLIYKQAKRTKFADKSIILPEETSLVPVECKSMDISDRKIESASSEHSAANESHCERIDSSKVVVDSIVMTGFSRGAWTANLLLPKLDPLGIPLYCISDQAVTGWSSQYFGQSNIDCSSLKHLRRYFGFVGDYHKHTSAIERNWFYQSLPTLPQSLYDAGRLVLLYLPHQDHFESNRGKVDASPTNLGFVHKLRSDGNHTRQEKVSPVAAHFLSAFKQCVNDEGPDKLIDTEPDSVVDWYYQQFQNNHRYYFTPETSKLPVNGMDKNENISLQNDPCYLKALRNFIQDKLKEMLNNSEEIDAISQDQACAVYHLCGDTLYDAGTNQSILSSPLIKLVLSDGEDADKRDVLIKIIKELGPICDYMRNERQLFQIRGSKREQVSKAIDTYRIAVLDACYQYIMSTEKNAPNVFGKSLVLAETQLISALHDYPFIYFFMQFVRELISNTLQWGVCYAKQINNKDFSKLKLPSYASAYVRVNDSQHADDNGLYYVVGAHGVKLDIDVTRYDALGFPSGPLSKEQQSAVSILTGCSPQRSEITHQKHRFFVPSPQEIIAYGAERVMCNIRSTRNRDEIESNQTKTKDEESVKLTPGKTN